MSTFHKSLLTVTLLLSLSPLAQSWAKEYNYEIKDENMTFAWTVNGENLEVRIAAQTTGWVAVGFNPSMRMKHANIIIGYVKDSVVVISDEYGFQETGHGKDSDNGGTANIFNPTGSEINGKTTLEFTIPLNSKDQRDININTTGQTTIILAYGRDDSLYSYHTYRGTRQINLTTGADSGELDHSFHGGANGYGH